jgi:hypothetical protein
LNDGADPVIVNTGDSGKDVDIHLPVAAAEPTLLRGEISGLQNRS